MLITNIDQINLLQLLQCSAMIMYFDRTRDLVIDDTHCAYNNLMYY